MIQPLTALLDFTRPKSLLWVSLPSCRSRPTPALNGNSSASIGQLKTLLQRPYEKVVEDTTGAYITASLDIALRTGMIEKLTEPAHLDTGLHARQLQEYLDLDPVKMTVVLRFLAARGWVYELSEGMFKLTRPALELREGENGWKWAMYVILIPFKSTYQHLCVPQKPWPA